MRILYNLFIVSLSFGLRTASLFGNPKAGKWVEGRKGIWERLQHAIPTKKEVVWFHCASVGEFEQARPLLEMIKKEYDYFILLTFFSPSGFEAKKNYDQADHIDYLPLDTTSNAKRFLKIVNPKLSFFAKYEFWFNFLNELYKGGFKHFLISGIFRPKQQFFRFYGSWFRKHLEHFDHLFLQDQNSKELLESFGIMHCSKSGDGRFDRVNEIAKSREEISGIEEFKQGKTAVIFGSSWEKENELAFQLAQKHENIKVVIAPHEFNKKEIEKLKDRYQVAISYFSQLKPESYHNSVMIIDQMGLLSRLYRYADIAIIGGGFKSGIHNTLEAAAYGIPIYFGPNYHFFKEAWDLIEVQGAKVFKNEDQFHLLLEEVLSKEKMRAEMGHQCKRYFEDNIGATSLIFNILKENQHLAPKVV